MQFVHVVLASWHDGGEIVPRFRYHGGRGCPVMSVESQGTPFRTAPSRHAVRGEGCGGSFQLDQAHVVGNAADPGVAGGVGSMRMRPKKSQSIHSLRRLAQSTATIPRCCESRPAPHRVTAR